MQSHSLYQEIKISLAPLKKKIEINNIQSKVAPQIINLFKSILLRWGIGFFME
jgi:hypothetical protein